ncbi:uncharacterized protein PITG_00104 [Phytophthora infestans T30-4]|uniref:Bzip transcription factor n=1 Tax=Phytophthora infestans (strain T30-4) TaxID=403677 RepID=D0MSW3_PHYIT|nr:uncharacterized protein PITG_00104 [Phytophthora infestans T30-4]EEY57547.1 conserved hypothetical protein [Phytophthora infestans T30-4]|eukprot:XP_002908733.1 conserved hypothetical protein [Phytophthora infestans T30-4]
MIRSEPSTAFSEDFQPSKNPSSAHESIIRRDAVGDGVPKVVTMSGQSHKNNQSRIRQRYTTSRQAAMHPFNAIADTFDVTPVRSRPVLAPRVPAVTALAAERRAPNRRKKLKWRTRDSQASQLYNLELDVMHLLQEIQRLAEYQQILDARTFNRRDALDGYYVKTVQEYHRVFENGYRPGSPLDATQYVMQTMDENLSIGGFSGRGVMLHQWEQYTKALSGLEFHYLRSQVLSMEGHTVVTSYASYKHIVTRDTVEVMFPEALRQYPRIVTKMLGRVFKGVGKFDFVFDTQTHNIISFEFELDFLEEFSRLLQDPRDLCAIFKGARITEECLIGDVTGYGEVTSSPNAGTIATAKVEKKTEASFDTDLEDKTPSGHSDEEWRQPSLTNRTGRRKEIWE